VGFGAYSCWVALGYTAVCRKCAVDSLRNRCKPVEIHRIVVLDINKRLSRLAMVALDAISHNDWGGSAVFSDGRAMCSGHTDPTTVMRVQLLGKTAWRPW